MHTNEEITIDCAQELIQELRDRLLASTLVLRGTRAGMRWLPESPNECIARNTKLLEEIDGERQ
jgi:hypothetical protein